MKIDHTHLQIMRHLRDGRKSFKEIADALSVTENTVRARVNQLVREEILDVTGLVDPEKLPGHSLVLVGIKLNTMNLVKKGEEFSRLKGVVSVAVVTGRYDLILTVLLTEEFGLLEFYTEEVDRVGEVSSAETFVVYKGYNARVPYVF
ncbi:MAG: Lrp/AsnC family transcriptional regulator [Spirochaetales bacterium]|nr:Lrp/AsnC family transcriptional regulator [Spirochaetales bacterium]